jgi:L-2,4-diaminobutyrate decarboxylase
MYQCIPVAVYGSTVQVAFTDPFNPEEFRKEGHLLVDSLSDYLKAAVSGTEMPVLPWKDPDELTQIFSLDSGGGKHELPEDFFKRIIESSIHIHHPQYIGHQVTSPLPLTVLAQFCTTLLNNGAAIYEMGPVSIAMEHNVVRKFAELIGYQSGSDGIFTHGGTAGNARPAQRSLSPGAVRISLTGSARGLCGNQRYGAALVGI